VAQLHDRYKIKMMTVPFHTMTGGVEVKLHSISVQDEVVIFTPRQLDPREGKNPCSY
jgi:hypothetical protein